MEQNRFDEILKQKMDGCLSQPPVDMFSRIEASMKQIDAASDRQIEPRAKRIGLWSKSLVRYAAAAVVAAVATTAVVMLNRPLNEVPMAMNETTVTDTETSTLVAESFVAAEIQSTQQSTASEIPTKKRAANVDEPVNVSVEVIAYGQPASEITSSAIERNEQKTGTTASAAESNDRSRRESKKREIYTEDELDAYWREVLDEDRRNTADLSRLSTTLYAGNIGIGRGDMNLSNINADPMLINENPMMSPPQFTSLPTAAPAKPEAKLQHRMPITFGLTLSYQIGEVFALESGLIYTNMFSASESSGTMSDYNRRRDLHYLGVPVAATCRLFSIKDLGFYMRVGGTVEKCIYGSDRYYLDGKLNTTTDLTVDVFQFSVDASVGMQYPLWRGLSIYGEGGISYYLPSEGQPESYRTVNPLNASLRLGFRYAFL